MCLVFCVLVCLIHPSGDVGSSFVVTAFSLFNDSCVHGPPYSGCTATADPTGKEG